MTQLYCKYPLTGEIEYCGKRDAHDYQLYLAVHNIEQKKTKAKSPQTKNIV
ncbi:MULTISPECIES: hypothetical protein [Bartonella]|uniref:hypothetical protein n=1 Tax=Bartonella TaxID=773 RepID=UPI0018DD56A0|nr:MULTISPECIES: hypothetical protein [Bartonella]MBH9975704.1 hypothetical protein [Bartonella choladocola]MBI0015311.1 hypothetical protein [Bartonella sp. B10834G3]